MTRVIRIAAGRARSTGRGRGAAVVLGTACLVLLAAAPAQAGILGPAKRLPPVPKVKPHHGALVAAVAFKGSGVYKAALDYKVDGIVHSEGMLTFSFESFFVAPTPHGRLVPMRGVILRWHATASASSQVVDEDQTMKQTCPQVSVEQGRTRPRLTVAPGPRVQAFVLVRATSAPVCKTVFSPPPPVAIPTVAPLLDGRGVAAMFDHVLPGPVTAKLPASALAVPYGASRTYTVSSDGIPAPDDCLFDKVTAVVCSQQVNWHGTVTISGLCAKRGSDNAKVGWCVDKRAATKAAKKYRKRYVMDRDQIRRVFKCGKPSPGKNAYAKPIFACLVAGIEDGWDYNHLLAAQKAANDPPDRRFHKVPRPRAPRQRGLVKLRRRAPHFVKLARREGKVIGLERAAITAMNRSTGASYAVLRGAGNAAGPLARQKRAVRKYGAKAAKRLRKLPALAHRAARDLRRASARDRRAGKRRDARLERRLAVSLRSASAKRAGRVQAAWLRGFGR